MQIFYVCGWSSGVRMYIVPASIIHLFASFNKAQALRSLQPLWPLFSLFLEGIFRSSCHSGNVSALIIYEKISFKCAKCAKPSLWKMDFTKRREMSLRKKPHFSTKRLLNFPFILQIFFAHFWRIHHFFGCSFHTSRWIFRRLLLCEFFVRSTAIYSGLVHNSSLESDPT